MNAALAEPPTLTSRVSYMIRLLHWKFTRAMILEAPGPGTVMVAVLPVPIGNPFEVQLIVKLGGPVGVKRVASFVTFQTEAFRPGTGVASVPAWL